MRKIDFGLAQKKKNMGGKDQLFVYFELDVREVRISRVGRQYRKVLPPFILQTEIFQHFPYFTLACDSHFGQETFIASQPDSYSFRFHHAGNYYYFYLSKQINILTC